MIRNLALISGLILILAFAQNVLAGEQADSKIKNAQLMATKALSETGDEQTNTIYKAKRELDRATLAEPKNPLPYYWKSIIVFYFDKDQAEADKLYQKAMSFDPDLANEFPPPSAYTSKEHLTAAFNGDFNWSQASLPVTETPKPPAKEPTPPPVEDPATRLVGLLDNMKKAIAGGQYAAAESLYGEIGPLTAFDKKDEHILLNLQLQLALDSIPRASGILVDLGKNKKSKTFKAAVAVYDGVLDSVLDQADRLERRGQFDEGARLLQPWEPYRKEPVTDARRKLLLQYASLLLSENELAGTDSALTFYDSSGYKKDKDYKHILERLQLAQEREKKEAASVEVAVAEPAPAIEPEAASKKPAEYVTLQPPPGEIMRVLIKTLDPATGQTASSEVWETAGPTRLKAGESYKILVQKKHEKKASKYVALAAILTTFLIMR